MLVKAPRSSLLPQKSEAQVVNVTYQRQRRQCYMSRIVVQPQENGPYLVIVDGKPLASLCRCGLSGTKPLCDRNHEGAGCTASGAPVVKSEPSVSLGVTPPEEPDKTNASSVETRGVCKTCGHLNPEWVRNYCVKCAARLRVD